MTERIKPAMVAARIPLQVEALALVGEPVPFADLQGEYSPIEPGTPWGRPWGTTWLHVTGAIPGDINIDSCEVTVDLGFTGSAPGFQAEGAVYRNGRIVCGVHPRNQGVDLDLVSDDGVIDFHVEAASNPDFSTSFRPSNLGSLDTAGSSPLYVFGGVRITEFHPGTRDLVFQLSNLIKVMNTFDVDHPRRKRIQFLIQSALDSLDLDDVPSTAATALEHIRPGLELVAHDGAHQITAIGHAHIDTAWLWPIRETRRKCARTFSNAVELMDRDPSYKFACSQAVQYSWVEEEHPELFERISAHIEEGQWVPVGGMWVEADMNIPSGESLLRQFIHGRQYFESRFGVRCTEVWIPDVFGYPGTLPQIFAAAGCTRFVTQKLSWNKQNKFPHHTFWWEGLDGTRVLTHFPPVDTYNAEVVPNELVHAVNHFRDHYWSDHSLMPFGYGDGGGGPTEEMMDRAKLFSNSDGLPRLEVDSPSSFFDSVEAEATSRPTPVWRGELYFEMHRGTYTSQVNTKVGNRRSEHALRRAELWLALASLEGANIHQAEAAAELDRLWKLLLTNQFHDIIPGSSIAWVHDDAERDYAEIQRSCAELIAASAEALIGSTPALFNAATHRRTEIVAVGALPEADTQIPVSAADRSQPMSDGNVAVEVEAVPLGVVALDAAMKHSQPQPDSVTASTTRLENSRVAIEIDQHGNISSFTSKSEDRELLPVGETVHLNIAPDHPVEFDAWDLEQWTAGMAVALPDPTLIEVADEGPLVGAIRIHREFGASTAVQTITLRAGSDRIDISLDTDWQESEAILALDVPLDIRTNTAACEIQFGYERRPTHRSTSWDDAKFEVCAHRWVDFSEPDFGVAVLNNGRYGYSVQGDPAGVRVSLLRATKFPDPMADRGRHEVTISLFPHGPGLADVVREAEALNLPLQVVGGDEASGNDGEIGTGRLGGLSSVVTIDDPRIQVAAVKLADDLSADIIVRLFEATGNRVEFSLRVHPKVSSVEVADIYEEPIDPAANWSPHHSKVVREDFNASLGAVELTLSPFQIATLRLRT